MRSEKVTVVNIAEYASFIPKEVYRYINEGSCRVTGVRLFNEPCGAAVWRKENSGNTGKLLSIYVDPPCRRIGAGKILLDRVRDEIEEEGISDLRFIFPFTGDRRSLVPFFEDMDVETVCFTFPFGRINLQDVINALQDKGLEKAKPCGKAVHELNNLEKTVLQRWLLVSFLEDLKNFTGKNPPSFVHIEGDSLRAALLFTGEKEGILSLDYVYEKDVKSLMGLFSMATDRLSEIYPAKTVIEVMLTNSNSVSLYGSLFGEPGEQITICNGRIKKAE